MCIQMQNIGVFVFCKTFGSPNCYLSFRIIVCSLFFLQKTSVWNKKNAGVLERAQRDLEQKKEEDDELERSRSVNNAQGCLIVLR